jgi:hypothetical protein
MKNYIFHGHIFKNAGTTFDSFLTKNFGDAFIEDREDIRVRKEPQYIQNLLSERPEACAFSSHSLYRRPVPNHDQRFFFIYFLRHPLDRALSVYNFERKQPGEVSLGAKMAKNMDFNEYILWRMRPDVPAAIRNQQTIYLSGMGPNENNINQRFLSALEWVSRCSTVGVVDEFAMSLARIVQVLNPFFDFPVVEVDIKNVQVAPDSTKIRDSIASIKSRLDDEVFVKLRDANRMDYLLYTFAKSQLFADAGEMEF